MNPAAANILVEGFLKGAFDVFEAMLSVSCTQQPAEPEILDADSLARELADNPVALVANIEGGLGSVGMLVSFPEAGRLAAMDFGADTAGKESLEEDELATLSEIVSSAIGGGVTNLMERFGRTVEQLEDVEVVVSGVQESLVARFGTDGTLVPFTFSGDPDVTGQGIALFDSRIEALIPAELLGEEAGGGSEVPTDLSPEEMTDILSGFDGGGGISSGGPDNLDMILDIRLVAIARLGRIELPIGEILGLGPGSIIEVGHLVDEPVELLVNDKLIARGDVVVVDEKFGLRITEIISQRERIESLQ